MRYFDLNAVQFCKDVGATDLLFTDCVMMVAGGYPGSYEKGHEINGLDDVSGSLVFHAGTRLDASGKVVTNGGRVLCVTTLDSSMPSALLKTYQQVDKISWQGSNYRHDIGQDLLKMMI